MNNGAFTNRRDAGQRLAALIDADDYEDPVVIALPRGGVPLAAEIAATLHAPLDVLHVRKIGAPGRPEVALGAVVEGSPTKIVINEHIRVALDVNHTTLEVGIEKAKKKIADLTSLVMDRINELLDEEHQYTEDKESLGVKGSSRFV